MPPLGGILGVRIVLSVPVTALNIICVKKFMEGINGIGEMHIAARQI